MFTRLLATLAAGLISLTVAGAPALASAASPRPPAASPAQEGFDYTLVKNARSIPSAGPIEVAEFFWYKCPHCLHMEPGLNKWEMSLPADVTVRRTPAVLGVTWAPAARLFYTLEHMKLVERLHDKAFIAYQTEKLNLDDPAVLGAWVAKQGVNRKTFESTYTSFTIHSVTLARAKLSKDYAIDGVPTFVVDGKYVTSAMMTGGSARLFEVLDQLVVKARAERAGKKKPLQKPVR